MNWLKFIIAVLFILISLCKPQAQEYQNGQISSTYLNGAIKSIMLSEHIAGLSACIIKEGQVPWIGTYGYANFDLDIKVDTSTLFELASVSKTVTLTTLMQLWEQELFDLDDNINSYLPFEVNNPNYPGVPITIKMLCTHTSGIEDNWSIIPYYYGQDSPIPLGDFLYDYLHINGINYDPNLNFYNTPPGVSYHYCNTAVAILGYLVEILGDSSFSYQTQENIFAPLQMNETAWFQAELDTNHIAMPYLWTAGQYEPYGYFGYSTYPAGQLRTSVNQLANFLICYMAGGSLFGEQILQSETIEEILTPQIPGLNENQYLIWYKGYSGGRLLMGHNGSNF